MSILTPFDTARSWWGGSVASAPKVHWHDGGVGPSTIVMINGWTASGLMWPESLVQRLERDARVIRIDNRGTGWSRSAPEGYGIGDLANDVADVLKATHVKKATIVGLSMGGMIAQEFAARRPELVESVFLLGTRPPTPAHLPGNPAELHAAMRPRLPQESWATYIRSIWARQLGPGHSESGRGQILDEIVSQSLRRTTPRAGVLGQARAVSGWSGPRLLSRIAAPTTVVHGACDPMIPVGNGHRLARGIHGAEYIEMPDLGHLVPYEAPNELANLLLAHRG